MDVGANCAQCAAKGRVAHWEFKPQLASVGWLPWPLKDLGMLAAQK